ncbi:hypothetical protein ACFVWF_29550 [Rhodococcus qingshengii]|uniref:hypothetical protein n=1 Tax=Rhodococcus qingshengii TaxID=334542 RepID=UPI0036DF62CF
MTILMAVGTAGAALPVVSRCALPSRVRTAHLAMVSTMAGMLIVGMSTWWAVLSSVVLVGAALYVTGEGQNLSRCVPCAVDLTAMAVLLLLMPATHGVGTNLSHSQHGIGVGSRGVAFLVLAGWAAFTLCRSLQRRVNGKSATGTALMIIGMASVAI